MMNLHQLRFVREAVRQKFNLTEVAKALFTSQPGVSKAIIELEEELGIAIFKRHGKRIRGLTEPGRILLQSVEKIMLEIDTLKTVGKEFAAQDSGNLTIATTHTQARYALPFVIANFTKKFPKVRLSILQGSPGQIADMVLNDQADIVIATELIADIQGLLSFPYHQWEHAVVVPLEHPILKTLPLTLEKLSQYPIVTYDSAFAGRSKIDQAFIAKHIKPDVRLEAIDADVIKTYVELGMGVGIIASMAYDAERDKKLQFIPAGNLFGTNISRVAFKKGAYLRGYQFSFLEMLAPSLNRKLIEQAIGGEASLYDL
jgi:LysR family cys regulon transcriptional activator